MSSKVGVSAGVGVSSGTMAQAPAAGLMSHTQAVMFNASRQQHSHRRLAFSLPEGKWRSAWPSLASLKRSSMYLL